MVSSHLARGSVTQRSFGDAAHRLGRDYVGQCLGLNSWQNMSPANSPLAPHPLLARGNSSMAISLAEQSRSLPRIQDALKAASSPAQTSGGVWGGELSAYRQLADAFLLSLRNIGVFDRMLPFMKQVPLHSQIVVRRRDWRDDQRSGPKGYRAYQFQHFRDATGRA